MIQVNRGMQSGETEAHVCMHVSLALHMMDAACMAMCAIDPLIRVLMRVCCSAQNRDALTPTGKAPIS